jgi:hypothetical protein
MSPLMIWGRIWVNRYKGDPNWHNQQSHQQGPPKQAGSDRSRSSALASQSNSCGVRKRPALHRFEPENLRHSYVPYEFINHLNNPIFYPFVVDFDQNDPERSGVGTSSDVSDANASVSNKINLPREGLLLIVATEEWTMRKTIMSSGKKIVKDIKRATR